jgi:exosortase
MPPFGSVFSSPARLSILSLLPAALTMLWLVLRARWFWNYNPELQFGWVVLVLWAYLFHEAWSQRPTPRFQWTWRGALLTSFGLGMLFFAQLYQAAFGVTTEGMSALGVGAMAFMAGNFEYVFGWDGLRRFAFAFAFFCLALPVPETIYYPLVSGLQSKVAALNVELLNLFGVPAERLGNAIRLPTCVVGIDEACSGIRSLQSTVMATLFLGHLTLRKRILKAALFGLGLLLAMGGNLLRSVFLSYTAHANGPKSIESYHDAAGWSILAFTAVGVAAAAWWFSRWEKGLASPPPETPTCGPA